MARRQQQLQSHPSFVPGLPIGQSHLPDCCGMTKVEATLLFGGMTKPLLGCCRVNATLFAAGRTPMVKAGHGCSRMALSVQTTLKLVTIGCLSQNFVSAIFKLRWWVRRTTMRLGMGDHQGPGGNRTLLLWKAKVRNAI